MNEVLQKGTQDLPSLLQKEKENFTYNSWRFLKFGYLFAIVMEDHGL
jgi:hypothetical protein